MKCCCCDNNNDDNAQNCIICGQRLVASQQGVKNTKIYMKNNDYKLSVKSNQFNPSDMIIKRKYKKKYTIYNFIVWGFSFLFFMMSFFPYFTIEDDNIHVLSPVDSPFVFGCMLFTTICINVLNFFMFEVFQAVFSLIAFWFYVLLGRAYIELDFVHTGIVKHVHLSFYASVVFLLMVIVFSIIGKIKHITLKIKYKEMPIY